MKSRIKKYFWRACQKKPWKLFSVDKRPFLSIYNLKCPANLSPVDLAHWPVLRTLEESRPRVVTLTWVLLAPRGHNGNCTQSALGKEMLWADHSVLCFLRVTAVMHDGLTWFDPSQRSGDRATEAPSSRAGLLQWSVEQLLLKCKC